MPHFRTLILAFAVLLLAGCAPGPSAGTTAPTTTPAANPALTPTNTSGGLSAAPNELVIWLPPTFDPSGEGEAAAMLLQRLQEFEAEHPGLTVRARIKAESGPGGLLETLSAANTVAPDALPDLIALDPSSMTSAALKGLVQPLDGVLARPSEDGWFPYAVLEADIDGGYYGYPFASDAQVFAYRTGVYSSPPLSWSRLLDVNQPFLFSAGDPDALYTLVLYQSVGGTLTAESGRPALDPTSLARVLALYASANSSGQLSSRALEFNSAAETWQELLDGRVAGASAPLSAFLQTPDTDFISAAPLPNQDGTGISVAYTWSWGLVSRDPERLELAAELVRWLHEPEFLGPWTEASGLLPPTTSALDAWQVGPRTSVVALLAPALQPRPSQEVLATFGPHLQQAVEDVFGGSTPDQAALEAAQSIQSP